MVMLLSWDMAALAAAQGVHIHIYYTCPGAARQMLGKDFEKKSKFRKWSRIGNIATLFRKGEDFLRKSNTLK
jgi:hypothetical protein